MLKEGNLKRLIKKTVHSFNLVEIKKKTVFLQG